MVEQETDGEKIRLKKLELKISYRKGDYIMLSSFIRDMGLEEIIAESEDRYFKYRLFNEIIKVLMKLGAVKEAGKDTIIEEGKKRRGRKAIVYKVVKDITMIWVIEA